MGIVSNFSVCSPFVNEFITAYVYAIANNETLTAQGFNTGKQFVTKDELLAFWQAEAATTTPTTVLAGNVFYFIITNHCYTIIVVSWCVRTACNKVQWRTINKNDRHTGW